MKKLWKLEWNIEDLVVGGLFIATDEEMCGIIGKEMSFGETAGSLNGLSRTIKDEDITFVSDSLIVVESVEKYALNFLKFPETYN